VNLVIRSGEAADAARCNSIFYAAFQANAERHNFPNEIAPPDSRSVASWARRLAHPGYYAVVAELDGRIVGSCLLDERDPIAGLGPLTVDPALQGHRIGRGLMEAVLLRAAEQRQAGVRLVQAAYNRRSLVLYTKLGFDVREPLASMQGPPLRLTLPGHAVRPATLADVQACQHLCRRVHGHERGAVLLEAIEQGTATVVEREDRLTGYATLIGFAGHAVGESNGDLKALIGAAPEFTGLAGFLVPTRNGELFRWSLANGLKVVLPLTLMSLGLYNEPAGAYLPSIFY
jgi:predicted N-acetyltransferase YhbS